MGARLSRQRGTLTPANAKTMVQVAGSNALRAALRKYIAAFNSLPPWEKRNSTKIKNLLNSPSGNGNMRYKNAISQGVAEVVRASRNANSAAVAAAVGTAPAAPAIAQVNIATNKLKNLNMTMAGLLNTKTGMYNSNLYSQLGRSKNNNRKLNSSRPNGKPALYSDFFNALNAYNAQRLQAWNLPNVPGRAPARRPGGRNNLKGIELGALPPRAPVRSNSQQAPVAPPPRASSGNNILRNLQSQQRAKPPINYAAPWF